MHKKLLRDLSISVPSVCKGLSKLLGLSYECMRRIIKTCISLSYECMRRIIKTCKFQYLHTASLSRVLRGILV